MLSLQEAFWSLEKLKSYDDIKLEGIVISNYIDKSFGRTYLRTSINHAGNIWVMHENTYISYRICNESGQELIKECEEVFNEQFTDALKLKAHIKSLFPDISVQILLSGYDFVKFHKGTYLSDLMLTGEICLEALEPTTNDNAEHDLEFVKECIEKRAEEYKQVKKNAKEYMKECNKTRKLSYNW